MEQHQQFNTVNLSLEELLKFVYYLNYLTNEGYVFQTSQVTSGGGRRQSKGGTGEKSVSMRTTWEQYLKSKQIVKYEAISDFKPKLPALPDNVFKNLPEMTPERSKPLQIQMPLVTSSIRLAPIHDFTKNKQQFRLPPLSLQPTTISPQQVQTPLPAIEWVNQLPIDIQELIKKKVYDVPVNTLDDYIKSKALTLVCKTMYFKLKNEYAVFYVNLKLDKLISKLENTVGEIKDANRSADELLGRLSTVYELYDVIQIYLSQVNINKIVIDKSIISRLDDVLSEIYDLPNLVREEQHNLVYNEQEYEGSDDEEEDESQSEIDNVLEKLENDDKQERINNHMENINTVENIYSQAKLAFLAEFLSNIKEYVSLETDVVRIKYWGIYLETAMLTKNPNVKCLDNGKLIKTKFDLKVSNTEKNSAFNDVRACLQYSFVFDSPEKKTFADIFYENFEYISDIHVSKDGKLDTVTEIIKKIDKIVYSGESRKDIIQMFKALRKQMKIKI